MNNPTSQWPADYTSWTGSFSDLVATAAEVVALLEPEAKAPTERTLRDYQQRGLLGRGAKAPGGNKAVFGFEDLERVVAAKGLLRQNFGLKHVTSLLNSTPSADSSVTSVLYASSAAPSVAMGGVAPAPSASDVVARLMAQPTASVAPALRSKGLLPAVGQSLLDSFGGLQGTAGRPVASPQTTSHYVSTPMEALRPTGWLTVYVDPTAAQGASVDERAQARAALQSLLDRLR